MTKLLTIAVCCCRRWRELLQKAADRQTELEEALRDAHRFAAEIQDLLSWLGEVDGVIAASKPVGGLPETASEQLERFMVSKSIGYKIPVNS